MAVKLPVMEAFYTIQGEGKNAGKAAYFIRLGGCDVGCSWCDVKESWPADAHPQISIDQLVADASNFPARHVVITGGEPLMYDLTELTAALKNAGFFIMLETSGAYPLSGTFDWICVSPKKFKAPLDSVLQRADELKVIVFNQNDLIWGPGFVTKLKADCFKLLQPEWSRETKMTPLIVDFVKNNPNWQISLQTHKYMQIP